MDKRYQVFVSSTYTDLVDERQSVIQILLKMKCIPAGMELFPAANEEQWKFIQRVIDDCDYYVLVIKHRYGSLTSEGMSYTEKEYDYAVSRGMTVLAFVFGGPIDENAEPDAGARGKLAAFKTRVLRARLASQWSKPEELPGLVATSLINAIDTQPAIGWVRGDRVAGEDSLNALVQLRKENDDLKKAAATLAAALSPQIPNLAGMGESVKVHGKYWVENFNPDWEVTVSWNRLFALLSPFLMRPPAEEYAQTLLGKVLFPLFGKQGTTITVDDQDFQTVKIQLIAYGLVMVNYTAAVGGGTGLFWSLTALGQKRMVELRAVAGRGV
jgi:hypothetical protein